MSKVVSNEKGISGSENHIHRIVAFITKTNALIHSSNYTIKLQSLFHFLHFPLFISQLFCFFLTFLVCLPFIAKDYYHTKLLQHSEKWALATIMNRTRIWEKEIVHRYILTEWDRHGLCWVLYVTEAQGTHYLVGHLPYSIHQIVHFPLMGHFAWCKAFLPEFFLQRMKCAKDHWSKAVCLPNGEETLLFRLAFL